MVCLSVCLSVCLLVTFVNPAKMAELIEMLFERLTRVDPKKHAVCAVQIPKGEWAIFGVAQPTEKHEESLG